MTIIAILISILVPAVGFVRETARGSQCRASLRSFYLGWAGLADRDKSQHYSSGAFDPTRDGCPDTIGWVADLVNAKVCKPAELLCPSNPGLGSEKYNDLMKANTSGGSGEDAPSAKQNLGACSSGSALTGTEVAQNFLAKGIGTNHMTTWFFSRSAPKTTGNSAGGIFTSNIGNCKGLYGSKGALTRRLVDQSAQTANTIPFGGDSNLGDIKDRFLKEDVVDLEAGIDLPGGTPLVESFSDGPYGRVGVVKAADLGDFLIFQQTGLTSYSGVAVQENPRKGQPKVDNINLTWLQDYRDFGPVHGGGCNVVFADGSVKTFADSTGDSFLNPGFSADDQAKDGYALNDNTVELPQAEIFSGILLEAFAASPKGNLD